MSQGQAKGEGWLRLVGLPLGLGWGGTCGGGTDAIKVFKMGVHHVDPLFSTHKLLSVVAALGLCHD